VGKAMTMLIKLGQWLLVGLTLALIYLTFLAKAYTEIFLLLAALIVILPVLEKVVVDKWSFLQPVSARLSLWALLIIVANLIFWTTPRASSEDRIEQEVARLEIQDILKEQQWYYLEQGQFAASLQELQKLRLTEVDQAYRYDIAVQETSPASVQITATALSGRPLKSYTGAVFILGVGTQTTSAKIICQSKKPSSASPEMPSLSSRQLHQPLCPRGAKDVTEAP
jgi:hypothetical protein